MSKIRRLDGAADRPPSMSDNVFLATDGVRNRPNLHLPKATINGRKGADCSRGGREEYLASNGCELLPGAGRQAGGRRITDSGPPDGYSDIAPLCGTL